MRQRQLFKFDVRQLLFFALAALAVYVFVPQFGDFRNSWKLVRHPEHIYWVIIAIAATLLTYPVAAVTYSFLAFRRLRIWQTAIVQLAAMFANRLLPAGIGALSINYLYLCHKGHRSAEAGGIVAMNNLVGFAGHLLLTLLGLGLFAFAGQQPVAAMIFKQPMRPLLLIMLAGVLLITVAGFWMRQRLLSFMSTVRREAARYRHRLPALTGALISSMTLTMCNVLSFVGCLLSLDIHISFIAAFLIFTAGVGAAIATPTPGGLGGFEAGLAAGLVANDIAPATALAAALLYRLISFWLPLTIGAPAIIFTQRRKLLDTR